MTFFWRSYSLSGLHCHSVCVWACWSKKRLISVTVPPSARIDSALVVSSLGTPRALSTVSFCAVHPPPAPTGRPNTWTSLTSNFSRISFCRLPYFVTFASEAFSRHAEFLSQITVGSTTKTTSSFTKMRSGSSLPFGPCSTGSQ